jgi:hypothetical protein
MARRQYPLEFRQQLIALVRAGRAPESLAKEFEPSALRFNWLSQHLEVRNSSNRSQSDSLTTGLQGRRASRHCWRATRFLFAKVAKYSVFTLSCRRNLKPLRWRFGREANSVDSQCYPESVFAAQCQSPFPLWQEFPP